MSPVKKSAQNRWVFLADPTDFGWAELVRDGGAVWDGVTAAPAQSNLRKCKKGDPVLIYHTSPDRALVGIARITKGPRSERPDEKQVVVDIAPVKPLARPLPLAELKADRTTAEMSFVRMPRIAVQPVTSAQWDRVVALGAKAAGRKGAG